MLAHKINEKMKYVKFPGFVQPKLDGMRCVSGEGSSDLFSRTGKAIVSVPSLKELIYKYYPNIATDGELYVHNVDFEDIMGNVRRTKNIVDDKRIQYWIYDANIPNLPFSERTKLIALAYRLLPPEARKRIIRVHTYRVSNMDEVNGWMDNFVSIGYEGLIFRNADSMYTTDHRSTDLLKMKRWHDMEVISVSFKEGKGKHRGRLGSIECTFTKGSEIYPVSVGGGFTDAQREDIWQRRAIFRLKTLTIKYQNLTKAGIPRFPQFLRWRIPE